MAHELAYTTMPPSNLFDLVLPMGGGVEIGFLDLICEFGVCGGLGRLRDTNTRHKL